MASVSLKERMKQLQELKSSVQAKSEAALAREKELSEVSQQSPVKSSNIGKLKLDALQDDTTTGGETQTTAGETAASPPLPPLPIQEDEEASKHEPLQAPTDNDIAEVHPEEDSIDKPATPDKVTEDRGEDEGETEEKDNLPGESDEVDEEIEIIEETEEIEGDTEGVEIEDVEEYVEVFEDDDEDDEQFQEAEETVQDEEVDDETHKEGSDKPEKTDEKIADEFDWGRRPIMISSAPFTEDLLEEAPMDEMAYLRRSRAQAGTPADEPSIGESGENFQPVFELLDDRDGERGEDDSGSGGGDVAPVFQLLDEDEEGAYDNTAPNPKSRATSQAKKSARSEPAARSKAAVKPRLSAKVQPTAATQDGESGSEKSRAAGLPKNFNDGQRRRWQCIICCLLVIGACSVAALVLPFVLDYDDPEPRTIAPTISPAPTMQPSASPTQLPTISPAPSDSPTQRPSTSPTISNAPTEFPSHSPTKNPTSPPTPAPTRAPTRSPTGNPTPLPTPIPTRAPVVPAIAPTTAPVVLTPDPLAPTPAPVNPTPAPTNPTPAPISPTRAPISPTRSPVSSLSQEPTTLRLGNFIDIFLVPISGVRVFEDQNSPQFKAAQFLAEEDEYEYVGSVPEETILAERYAMVTFYFATGGDNWNQCFVGDTTCFGPWLDGDICSWDYLSCNDAGRIVSIAFDGEYVDIETVGLIGTIPPEIYILEELEDLIIIDESIGGTLPERFGTDAPSMRQVVIQGAQLEGAIPNGYLANSPLESFILSSNNLNGPIPLNVGTPGTLTEMDLSRNKLVGTLPGGLIRYSSLATLALDTNILRGTIPAGIYGMTSLERLHLRNNPLLSGTIASSVGDMRALSILRLGDTGIGGLLPDELFTLPNLLELDLRDASFRGPLLSEFSGLGDTLQRLYLQENSFTGTVPVTFGDLSNLNVLSLEGNNLGGSIADEICALRRQDLDELSVDCDLVACSCCTECFR